MPFHFHANQSHFHKNDFALRLALKQRHKGTRKWPIKVYFFLNSPTTGNLYLKSFTQVIVCNRQVFFVGVRTVIAVKSLGSLSKGKL